MKQFISALAFILLISSISFAQKAPGIEWQKCYGGSSAEDGNGSSPGSKSIIQTSDGGYIMTGSTGSFNGDVSGLHSNNTDIWVVKISNAGLIEWQKCLGGSGEEWSSSIIQTSDGGYAVSGITTSNNDGDVSGTLGGTWDAWVVKLDSLGKIQWQKCLGGAGNDLANSIIQTSNGDYVVAGTTDSNPEGFFNHGNLDAYIIKINSSGNVIWQKCFGGSWDDQAYCIIETADSGYAFVGGTASYDGDLLGIHKDSTKTNYDLWVVKISTFGTIEWQKCLGGTSGAQGFSIVRSFDGGYAICGVTQSNDGDVSGNHGNEDAWVVKIDSLGSIEWQKCLGGSSRDLANSIIQTTDHGYAITGSTVSIDGDVSGYHPNSDSLHYYPDVWVVKLDSIGTLEWQKCLGGNGFDDGFSIIQSADGEYVIGAIADSNNGDVSTNHGGSDIWVIKLGSLSGVSNSILEQTPAFQIYPNPSSDQVHLQIPDAESFKQLEFYDLLGKKLSVPYSLEGNLATIDVHNLMPATYIARVSHLGSGVKGTYSLPLIVQH